MATVIGKPTCVINTSNSGTDNCAFQRAPIKYVIAVPNDYVFTAASVAALKTTLQTDAIDDARADRIFFLGAFSNSEPQVTEATFDTAPDGSKLLVRNEIVNMRLEMRGASACDQKALASFRGIQKGYKFLFYQTNGILWGQYQQNATTKATEIVGAKAQLVDVPLQIGSTYEAASLSYLDLNFLDMRNLQDNEAWVDASGLGLDDTFDEYRVTTVSLEQKSLTITAGAVPFIATSSCGADLGMDYAADIDTTCIIARNVTTGLTLAITSVSVNSATGVITAVLTTPPASGTKVRVTLAAVSVLAAAGISWYETLSYIEYTIA